MLRITKERLDRQWRMEDVARQVGITKPSIHQIEHGKNKPSFEVLVKLENLFGLTHRELFEEVDMEKAQ